MRNKYILIGLVGIVVGVLLASVVVVLAGNPDSPGAPGATNSFALDDIYNRLDTGAAGAQTAFTEPAAGPGATGHTLDEVMAKAPVKDDTNGAATGDVANDKTFWGLTAGEWGMQTGTAAGAVCTGDATAGDVLIGKTFSNATATGIDGTMPDKEGDNASTAQAQAGGVNYFTAPQGYYDGDDRVSATDAQVAALDADITAGNIKSGQNIFGVGGTLAPGGTATVADLFNGKTAHLASDWTLDTGTLDLACNTATFNGTANRVADAYDGAGDGTNRWCMTESGDAAAADIANGKKAWVDGSEVTGTAAAGGGAGVPKTWQTKCYNAAGTERTCAGTGEDGELQKDVDWPSPRFTKPGDGTVTDNLTGLIWLQNANCAAATRNWQTALNDVAQLNTNGQMNGNLCGDTSNGGTYQTDWRLPNVREMQSLVHYGVYDPAVPNTNGPWGTGTGQWAAGDPFDNVQSNYYWSSTTYAFYTDHAWYVTLNDGFVSYDSKTYNHYVWPVRGGQ